MKNSENTKQKLLDTVAYLIKKDGIHALNIAAVAKIAGVSEPMVHHYFRDEDQLIMSYIQEKDFWNKCPDPSDSGLSVADQIRKMLTEQFSDFYSHCEMEAVLLHEEVVQQSLTAHITRKEIFMDHCAYYDIISKLLLMGTDQLVLAQCVGRSGQCEENELAQQKKLWDSIAQVVEWTFG